MKYPCFLSLTLLSASASASFLVREGCVGGFTIRGWQCVIPVRSEAREPNVFLSLLRLSVLSYILYRLFMASLPVLFSRSPGQPGKSTLLFLIWKCIWLEDCMHFLRDVVLAVVEIS